MSRNQPAEHVPLGEFTPQANTSRNQPSSAIPTSFRELLDHHETEEQDEHRELETAGGQEVRAEQDGSGQVASLDRLLERAEFVARGFIRFTFVLACLLVVLQVLCALAGYSWTSTHLNEWQKNAAIVLGLDFIIFAPYTINILRRAMDFNREEEIIWKHLMLYTIFFGGRATGFLILAVQGLLGDAVTHEDRVLTAFFFIFGFWHGIPAATFLLLSCFRTFVGGRNA